MAAGEKFRPIGPKAVALMKLPRFITVFPRASPGGWLLEVCFLREAPERAIGGVFAALQLPKPDRRAGEWGLREKRGFG